MNDRLTPPRGTTKTADELLREVIAEDDKEIGDISADLRCDIQSYFVRRGDLGREDENRAVALAEFFKTLTGRGIPADNAERITIQWMKLVLG